MNYHGQTELSWSDYELSWSDWTIMVRLDCHGQTELSWLDWTIVVRLDYHDQNELSWSDYELSWSDCFIVVRLWTIMVRLNYHHSWSDWTTMFRPWTIMIRLNYHDQTELSRSDYELSWSDIEPSLQFTISLQLFTIHVDHEHLWKPINMWAGCICDNQDC